MNEKIYKYKSNKKTIIATAIHFVVLSILAVLIGFMYVGGYFSAWFISLVVALITLMTLSIPRRIIVNDNFLTITCILEIVEIPTNEIASVSRVEAGNKSLIITLFGSIGFFGYYGYYIDLATFERVRLYATEWQNLVEIVDIYDDRYIVSCRQADELIEQIEGYIAQNQQQQNMEQ